MPLWSADSQGILFQRPGSNETWKIALPAQEAPARDVVALRSPDKNNIPTVFLARSVAPDGRVAGYFLQVAAERTGWAIGVASAGADAQFQALNVLRTGTNVPLSWSPDGRTIDAVDPRDQNVWRYPIGGGHPTRLTHFRSGSLRAFAWSRDGHRLALSHGSDRADVVLITNSGTP